MQSDLIIVSPTSAAMTLAHPALASLRCLHFHFLLRFMSFRRRLPHAAYLSQQPPLPQLNSCPLPAPLARQRSDSGSGSSPRVLAAVHCNYLYPRNHL